MAHSMKELGTSNGEGSYMQFPTKESFVIYKSILQGRSHSRFGRYVRYVRIRFKDLVNSLKEGTKGILTALHINLTVLKSSMELYQFLLDS